MERTAAGFRAAFLAAFLAAFVGAAFAECFRRTGGASSGAILATLSMVLWGAERIASGTARGAAERPRSPPPG